MEFQKEVFSKILSKDDYNANFKEIIQIIDKDQDREVEILFGVAWGNEYKDWTPFKVPVYLVEKEIHLAEQLKVGKFGGDDFYITINELQTQILFCHEMDIHLRYNKGNPIIQEVLQRWETKDLIHNIKQAVAANMCVCNMSADGTY
jgi:hypothetical protein